MPRLRGGQLGFSKRAFSSGSSIPNLSHKAETSVKSFSVSAYPLWNFTILARDTPNDMAVDRACAGERRCRIHDALFHRTIKPVPVCIKNNDVHIHFSPLNIT